MNKTAIKNFSIWARNKLIADVSYKAGLMGITANGIAKPLPQSTGTTEFYDIGTKEPYAISGEAVRQRRLLVDVMERKAKESDYATAYKYVLEEVAYTWFNRLIAIRFMEVNDYLPSHVRVLSSDSGKMEPDLVTSPFDAELDFTEAEKDAIRQMKLDNAIDELFQMLFIKQCNALNAILPGLFEKTSDYTELLLSVSVIDQDGVVYHLVHDIPEEDFDVNRGGQVEIIGWLYQYYNTEPKNEAFAKTGKITKDEIPAVTQLFTPDWIVRYMVENSLGRLWVEGHPNDSLKKSWKYYLEEAEQEPEVQAKLAEIRAEYAKLNPEDIKVIDPCMGSGHILVYAFDVLMQIYESAGWSRRDAAASILEHNLYGLDIDDRAYQLAYFAVMMKARQFDRRFFNRSIQPEVYAPQNYADGKEYGSLLHVDRLEPEPMGQLDLFSEDINTWNFRNLLAQKYHVVVTNPPYMGASGMNGKLAEFVSKTYPDSKGDLFACFVERGNELTVHYGCNCMVTMQSWMFLSSYESLRNKLMATRTIKSLLHMENMVMGIAFGTAVTSFWDDHITGYTGTFTQIRMRDIENGVPIVFPNKNNRYAEISTDSFSLIKGSPIAYWASSGYLKVCESGITISSLSSPRTGMTTGDNNRFLRLWSEVSSANLCLFAKSSDEALQSGMKWFPYLKGGDFRRWYGNLDYVINWLNDGHEIKTNIKPNGIKAASVRSEGLYFKPLISWSAVSSGIFSCRANNGGALFDSGGSSLYLTNNRLFVLALLNTKIGQYALDLLNPTINYQPGDIANIPLCLENTTMIEKVVEQCIACSKEDWDSFENSWDFEWHPLVRKGLSRFHWNAEDATIEECFRAWAGECDSRFSKLKANEEELNRIFIEIYGLQDELTPEVEDKDVTVRRADLQRDIKSLLSYAVGCMFGRYSIGSTGLAYAGGEWDARKYSQFKPDADNIIPLTDEDYLEDDIISRLCDFLKIAFGERTLETNLDYIATALGGKGNSSREIIRNYYLNSFFDDHCQAYSVTGSGRRPIYWLFDSGKQNGFKALIYLHRYNADTIGNLRVDYLHKMQRVYESEIGRMQDTIDHSSNAREIAAATKRKEKLQKQLKECRDYDEKIGHLALSRIELDLDDGVKVNYRKLQTAQDGKFYEVLAKSKDIMAKEK